MFSLPRERLARLEPALALGAALHGALILVLGHGEAVYPWLAALVLFVLGAAGPLHRRSRVAMLSRAIALFTASLVIGYSSGGVGSSMTVWFALAGLVYPAVIANNWGLALIPLAAAFYAPLIVAPDNTLSGWNAMVRVLLVAVPAYLVWGLRSSSELIADESKRTELELRQLKDRFEVAFANSSSGMAMIELTGRINQANQALADFFGTRLTDLEGSDWRHYIHPEDRTRVDLLTAQLTGAEIWSYQEEVRCVTAESKVVWGLLGVALVTDGDGNPQYLFAHFQDITGRVASETLLRRNEQHYRNLFQNSPVPIWEADYTDVGIWLEGFAAEGVTDLRHHLRYRPDLVRYGLNLVKLRDVNDIALTLLEVGSVEELARNLTFVLGGDRALSAVVDQFVAMRDGTDRVQSEIGASTLRGRQIEGVLHWVAPMVEGRRDVSKVTVAFADVTQYRAAQEALQRIEERLRAVVSAAPIFLFALDEHGVFTLSEGQALTTLALSSAEVVGRSAFELFRDSPAMIAAVRRALAGEAFTTSIEVRNRGFDARFSPMWEEARVTGVIAVANDVTDRMMATEQLEQLVRSKDQFVAGVSHELRTPLTAVVGFAQELREGLDRFSRDELEVFVRLIAEQSIEVADLVEDLLVAARADVDAIAIAPESIELAEQVELVMLAWQASQSRDVKLKGKPAKAFADPVRLRQILRNLLSNAQRYGGPKIEVETVEGAGEVMIRVRDNGRGIPQKDRTRIFEPYFRAHRPEGTTPSSVGLGLTVSRQLARLMNGDLTYRYEDGWSIFDLALPTG